MAGNALNQALTHTTHSVLYPAVKGLLLYGPPGTGKTMLAREISRALKARTPKIVAAPELLDRWVGGSEKLVRSLFSDAVGEMLGFFFLSLSLRISLTTTFPFSHSSTCSTASRAGRAQWRRQQVSLTRDCH